MRQGGFTAVPLYLTERLVPTDLADQSSNHRKFLRCCLRFQPDGSAALRPQIPQNIFQLGRKSNKSNCLQRICKQIAPNLPQGRPNCLRKCPLKLPRISLNSATERLIRHKKECNKTCLRTDQNSFNRSEFCPRFATKTCCLPNWMKPTIPDQNRR